MPTATAAFRKVELRPISQTPVTLGTDRGREWRRLITRAGLAALPPSDYTEAIKQVAAFADPVITSKAKSAHWDHRRGRWAR